MRIHADRRTVLPAYAAAGRTCASVPHGSGPMFTMRIEWLPSFRRPLSSAKS